jgi:hypothetical protein
MSGQLLPNKNKIAIVLHSNYYAELVHQLWHLNKAEQKSIVSAASPDFLTLAVLTHDNFRPHAHAAWGPAPSAADFSFVARKCQLLIVITSTQRIAYEWSTMHPDAGTRIAVSKHAWSAPVLRCDPHLPNPDRCRALCARHPCPRPARWPPGRPGWLPIETGRALPVQRDRAGWTGLPGPGAQPHSAPAVLLFLKKKKLLHLG